MNTSKNENSKMPANEPNLLTKVFSEDEVFFNTPLFYREKSRFAILNLSAVSHTKYKSQKITNGTNVMSFWYDSMGPAKESVSNQGIYRNMADKDKTRIASLAARHFINGIHTNTQVRYQ